VTKINTQIKLDLDNVDLRATHITSLSKVAQGPEPGFQIPPMYEAYSGIMHSGTTTHGGHYVAVTRNLDEAPGPDSRVWRAFDDMRVSKRTLVQQESAVGGPFQLALLFLRRKRGRP